MSESTEEQWRAIVGYEGLYEVSDQGRVRTLHPNFYGRIRKPEPHPQGYLAIKLYRDGIKEGVLIHRLVAEAFCPRREGMDVVRHFDGDKRNNQPSNLVWGDHHENSLDTVRHGRHRNARKTHCRHGHAYDEANTGYKPGRGMTWRYCRTCLRQSSQRIRDAHKARASGLAA